MTILNLSYRRALTEAFEHHIPPGLNVALVHTPTQESLCLSGDCQPVAGESIRAMSAKYAFHSSLSLHRFVRYDTQAGIAILLAPFFFILIFLGLKYWAERERPEGVYRLADGLL
ncbi:Uncharacterised protein [Citrobacter koseri]|uniref:Uncharacterized protein n=1 Tax=Citrobacter koseri TaxID=545 RepID=A0A2X2WW21_CITKO|nr:Uncharacterised protein [Citrobacter koseri]